MGKIWVRDDMQEEAAYTDIGHLRGTPSPTSRRKEAGVGGRRKSISSNYNLNAKKAKGILSFMTMTWPSSSSKAQV